MEQLLAVIILTYKESVRKRVFWLILFFTVLLITSSALFPVINPADRVKLVEAWSLRWISLFGMTMIIFLAAVSIPEDIEDKKFLIIFTKPLARGTFITGKLIGYIVVMAIFVTLIGLLSLGYLKVVNALSSPTSNTMSPLDRLRQPVKAKEFSFIQPGQNTEGNASGTYLTDEEQPLEIHLSGAVGNYAAWRFEGLDRRRLTNPVKVQIRIGISEKHFRFASSVIIGVKIYEPKTRRYLLIPLKEIEIRHLNPAIIEVDSSLIDQFGDLELCLRRINPESELIVTPESVQILSAAKSYSWNYLKYLGFIFFQVTLLTILVVMGSTFLSSGITVFFGFFMLFCGAGMSFFKESLKAMERAIQYTAPLEITQRMGHIQNDAFPLWLMKLSKFILNYAFKILPDFSIFHGSSYLAQDIVIPGSTILDAVSYLGLFGLVSTLIAWFCFRRREFK